MVREGGSSATRPHFLGNGQLVFVSTQKECSNGRSDPVPSAGTSKCFTETVRLDGTHPPFRPILEPRFQPQLAARVTVPASGQPPTQG